MQKGQYILFNNEKSVRCAYVTLGKAKRSSRLEIGRHRHVSALAGVVPGRLAVLRKMREALLEHVMGGILALSLIFVSAPFSTRHSTTSRCPCLAARCRGVLPICEFVYTARGDKMWTDIMQCIHIGARADEEADDFQVALLRGDVQGRASELLRERRSEESGV